MMVRLQILVYWLPSKIPLASQLSVSDIVTENTSQVHALEPIDLHLLILGAVYGLFVGLHVKEAQSLPQLEDITWGDYYI